MGKVALSNRNNWETTSGKKAAGAEQTYMMFLIKLLKIQNINYMKNLNI